MSSRAARMCLGLLAASVAPALLADDFSARLGRAPVDTRTQSQVAGIGHADAELDGSTLSIAGDFSGLLGPATTANLHLGRAVGARGPVIGSLSIDKNAEGRLSGSVRLNRDQIEALRAGRLYIQIDSEIAPEGNLWGWLFADE